MKKLLFLLIIFLFTCSDDTEPEEPETPKIGPAGGYVFYDKGSYTDGWRYLESAPADTMWCLVQDWGPLGVFTGVTSTAVGTGESNTAYLIAWFSTNSGSSLPVQLCNNLNTNGYDDWFLPSRDELDKLRRYIHKFDIDDYWGICFTGGTCLSSSEYDVNTFWSVSMGDPDDNGDQIDNKNSKNTVLAIRSY